MILIKPMLPQGCPLIHFKKFSQFGQVVCPTIELYHTNVQSQNFSKFDENNKNDNLPKFSDLYGVL